ncbi:MAG: hypothetical protein C0596_13060 [Marinilabiliales bacterium]|nr:MAG: hypothetical protein C0596_13060 [Marinilabiliales bacterium]
MRKFTILLSLVLLASLAMAQVNMKYQTEATKAEKTKKVQTVKADPLWEVTFEEATPVWTFGQNEGTKTWAVSDTTPDNGFTYDVDGDGTPEPTPPLWLYMGWKYVHDYSVSGGNFAWIDGISDLLGLSTAEILDSYIQFDGIDLTGVTNPKLTFYQDYKALNTAYSYLDFSVDGGTTWTSVQINEDVEGNAYGEDYFEFVATPYIADEGDVSIRFRWQTTAAEIGGYGYGWQIDDIQIVDNPDYDMKYIHGVMNFFEYYDYTDPEYAPYYHISSHYGNLPAMQYDYDGALSWFNVCVENKGNITVAPDVTVEVLDPEMNSIFTNTVTGNELATAEKDTVDLIETDFALGTDPAPGKYTVVYNITIDGQEDFNTDNNTDTTYFIINDDQYFGRDIESTSAYTGPGTWLDGGVDGEMFGTDFLFLFEGEVTSMDVFINDNTTSGTAIIGHVMEYDSDTEDWVDVGTSSLITLDESNIGNWLNIEFTDPVMIVYDEGYESKTLLAAIEFYYNDEENDIYVGYDPTVPVSSWGTKWKLLEGSNAGEWISISNWSRGGLNLHLNFNGFVWGMSTPQHIVDNMNVYPNPTTGILNIEGIEGADVQILNMMGQVVESVENINEYSQIDMSNYANGTYFLRALVDGNVVTRKINLMK